MAQSTTTRPAGQRRPAQEPRMRSKTSSPVTSIVTLGRWQLHQTWRLLIIVGVGLLAAVILVCAIPLYAQVSESAGLHHVLASDPNNAFIVVHSQNPLFDSKILADVQSELSTEMQRTMGAAVSDKPDLSVQISTLTIARLSFIRLVGADSQQIPAHLKLLQGRLPVSASGDVIEFAVTAQGVQDYHFQLGKVFSLSYNLVDPTGHPIKADLKFRLVGIFAPPDAQDLFWHGETFAREIFSAGLSDAERQPVLVSNQQLMSTLNTLSLAANQRDDGSQFSNPSDTYWYYRFDFSHVDVNRLPELEANLKALLTSVEHNPEEPPYIANTSSLGPLAVLQSYANRVTVINLPVLVLTFLTGGLILFFVLLMTDLLVERQVTAITLLRSRGASARQIFGSLLWQSLGLGLSAFVLGPLLAISLVGLLVGFTLQGDDRGSLGLITANPLSVAQGLVGRDLIVIGLAILAMILSTWRVMRSNILIMRRESSRSTRQPFWLRFKLDILAAVIALAGFVVSLYIASPGVLDVRTRTLILPLTSMIGVLFLLVFALLLFLRTFPALLRLGERWASRNRGAAPLLALAQMARSPRQSLRMTLLFALAVAFALFTLIYSQTQAQRLPDLTTYQVGSDISGKIPNVLADLSWDQQLAFYRDIKGVTSVTMGMSDQVVGGSNSDVLIDLRAVDTNTYARTIYWTEQYGSQPPGSLMNKLIARRAAAEKKNVVPAIIDDAAAQSLNVTQGRQFVLKDFHGAITYSVVEIVHYIPTIYDTTNSTGSDASISRGGVLVDYDTESVVALAVNQEGLSPDTVWLRTGDRPADLANVRSTLFKGTYALDNPQDRRIIAASLSNDPLYAAIVGILAIGAAVALLLALLGNLMVSWLNARSRKTSFAVMRALGCAPRQITSVLLWEQGIVYTTALLLGVGLSILFSLVILPVFVFSPLAPGSTATASAEAFYIVQSVPAIHTIVPFVPIVALLAGLVVICVVALGMMVRIVTQPQMSQELRVDED